MLLDNKETQSSKCMLFPNENTRKLAEGGAVLLLVAAVILYLRRSLESSQAGTALVQAGDIMEQCTINRRTIPAWYIAFNCKSTKQTRQRFHSTKSLSAPNVV